MPADTMQEMILGYAVILVVLLTYVLSLTLRIWKAKKHQENPHRYKSNSSR